VQSVGCAAVSNVQRASALKPLSKSSHQVIFEGSRPDQCNRPNFSARRHRRRRGRPMPRRSERVSERVIRMYVPCSWVVDLSETGGCQNPEELHEPLLRFCIFSTASRLYSFDRAHHLHLGTLEPTCTLASRYRPTGAGGLTSAHALFVLVTECNVGHAASVT